MDDTLAIEARDHVAERVFVTGDKSISHRAVLLAALASGKTAIAGLNRGADVAASVAAVRAIGAAIDDDGSQLRITGAKALATPAAPLHCANSGTTMRLLAGMLAARCDATLSGDASLSRRPMERVAEPLRRMGATIETTDGHAPIRVSGRGRLRGIEHVDDNSSAQVQSALLLAGLHAEGATTAATRLPARDHTQRMLAAMGADVTVVGGAATVRRGRLSALATYAVPGDVSTACYFFVAAAIADARICASVGVNPTRTGALDVMRELGVSVSVSGERTQHGEPAAEVAVGGRPTRGCDVPPELIPNLIDEIPVLCALAATTSGAFAVRGAAELRVKESDRIAATARLLRAFGARVDELDDGITVHGGSRLTVPARVDTGGDHRIGMTAAALATGLGQTIVIDDAACIATSVPGFPEMWTAAFCAA